MFRMSLVQVCRANGRLLLPAHTFQPARIPGPKTALVELVESHGHIAFFYPKFHCELNFIEQCWGAAKYQYRILPLTLNEAQMEKNVRSCLDGVDLIKMRRLVQFMSVRLKPKLL